MLRAGRRTLLIKIVARTKGGYGETVVKSTVRVKAIDSLMKEIRRARTLRISSLILNGPCLFFILTSLRFGPQSLETQRMPAKKSSWKAPSGIYWAILELRNTPPYIQQPKYHPSRALWHCAVALQWVGSNQLPWPWEFAALPFDHVDFLSARRAPKSSRLMGLNANRRRPRFPMAGACLLTS